VTVAPFAGAVIETVGGAVLALFTVTETPALVVFVPAVSVAIAVNVCVALLNVVVLSGSEYGDVVSAAPEFAPSTWNCTLAIPMLEDALAVTVIVPLTVVPLAGAVMETVGGAVLVLFTVTDTPALVVFVPAVSVAIAVNVCFALLSVVVLSDSEYGDVVSAAPEFAPSIWNCTLAIPMLEDALAVTVIVPLTVAPLAGAVMETVGGAVLVLFTVTDTPALVVFVPAVSVATAVNVCVALLSVVVFKDSEYGAVVSAAPEFAPSTWNCTLAIPMLEDALAVTVIVPLTVAPLAGAVMEAVGGAVLALFTVTDTPALVVLFPAVSVATAANVCVALLSVVVFKDSEYGAVVSAAPEFAPSTWNCTLAIPMLEDAVAVTVMVALTVVPLAGAVIETVGGVVPPGLFTVIETPALVVLFPAVSVAIAVSVCFALLNVVVFNEIE